MGFVLFLLAAIAIALSPGPGLLYVAARSVAGGRGEGIASSFGTAIGGLVHVIAGAIGLSALIMASAEIFTIVKLVGACYLVWLGIRAWRSAGISLDDLSLSTAGNRRAFLDGIVVEVFNPKTAAFFLAFTTQFIDPAQGHFALQFVILGSISVFLNTSADLIVVVFATSLRRRASTHPHWFSRLQKASGGLLVSLGIALAFARRPAV
ncbi:LysE family translocator [Dongia sp.]|uniref:LysE family translocator n=1 Tax=Dongia sp. TaxID=1977262 RepID=UPI0035AE24D4